MNGIAGRRLFLLLGLTAIYAACFAVIKAGLAFAPPLLFGGLRALIGGLFLFGWILVLREPVMPPRQHWGGIIALALTATTLAFGAMFLSPGRTGAGIASVLGNTQPLIVIVLAALFLGEPVTRPQWITLIFGLVGVTLISWQALAGPDAYGVSGAVLALTASGGAALGSVLFKRMEITTGLLAVTAWQLVLGSLPLLAASVIWERNAPVIWNPEFVIELLFLALAGTSFANAVWYWLIQRGAVGELSLFLFMVPVFGLGLAVLVFGEQISWLEGLGLALTLAGIGLIARAPDGQALPKPLESSFTPQFMNEAKEHDDLR
ncbi:MAG: EamA family transporter [Anaerolineales bacterium]